MSYRTTTNNGAAEEIFDDQQKQEQVISVLSNNIKEFKQEKMRVMNELQKLQGSIQRQKDELIQLDRRFEELHNQREQFEEEPDQQREILEVHEKELERQLERLEKLQEQLERFQDEKIHLEDHRELMEREKQEIEQKISEIQQQIQQLEQELKEILQRIQNLETELRHFPLTTDQEEEHRRSTTVLNCVKCRDLYTESENKMGACNYHDGFVYDNLALDLKKYKPSDAIEQLNREEFIAFKDGNKKEEIERQKTRLKYICCSATFQVGGGFNGCKKGKHNPGDSKEINDEGKLLDKEIIDKWETICFEHLEYNLRWSDLFITRQSI
ncbi:unnamed protein product [Rotaria magnacalcarata]|uniref:Uncharacterized protein n=1 Tax=Rotaria magnacalcarata TaxID=392030 RepID=A0A819N7V3_9BILA|nr:unnamed protein product [Rotaria magnacalcarata]